MSEKTESLHNGREVPDGFRRGKHVTVVHADGSTQKGIVERELRSAIYVDHRISGQRLGTFSLASIDDQLSGTLAQRGHKGEYRLSARMKVESMPLDDGDAPIRPEVVTWIIELLGDFEGRMGIEELIDNTEKLAQIQRELRRLQAK